MTPHDAARSFWLELVKAWRIEAAVRWLDRQLRRWPWLYRQLSR
jgi:hypothetical protein